MDQGPVVYMAGRERQLIMGQISGVIVVDIDTQEGYDNLNEYSDHR